MVKFLVAVGTYERIIYGLDVTVLASEENASPVLESKVAFALPAHTTGYVKCVASCPKYLVTGGTDEVIRIFDLARRKDIGSINNHEGTVKALDFYHSSHLLSAGDDGVVALFRCKDWECLHVLSKHKKPINAMRVHPSGKLAVALDFDKNLMLWNLVTGKLAHSAKIPALGKLESLAWSASGSFYALLGEGHLLCFETQSMRKVIDLKASTNASSTRLRLEKWLCVAAWKDEGVFFAGEGSSLHYIRFAEPTVRLVVDTKHSPRIRTINTLETAEGDFVITAASNGAIHIFAANDLFSAMRPWGEATAPSATPLLQHNCELRVTCATVTLQE